MNNRSNIDNMKYWVQNILPQSYADSLSYQELLYKVIFKLNETIDLANVTRKEFEELYNYMQNGGLPDAILSILNEWFENGKLAELINDEIFGNINKDISEIEIYNKEITGYGVISGLNLYAQSNPNMSVLVSGGVAHTYDGKRYVQIENANLSVPSANALYPRYDIVYISKEGILEYGIGEPSSTPVKPTATYGVTLGYILVEPVATIITQNKIDVIDSKNYSIPEIKNLLDGIYSSTENNKIAIENVEADVIINSNKIKNLITNVKEYGAIGDGITDDTIAFKNAISTLGKAEHLYVPTGTYIISETLLIDKDFTISGTFSGLLSGSILKTESNIPIFRCKAQSHFESLIFMGSLEESKTEQVGIFIDDTNGVTMTECHFSDFYDCVRIFDTSFYCRINSCVFYACINSMVYGYGTSQAGYQFECNNTQIVSSGGRYGFYLENIGSVFFNHVEISPAYLGVGLWIKSDAPLGGAKFYSQVGIEALKCVKLGDDTHETRYNFFSNCYWGGNVECLDIVNASSVYISNSYLASNSSSIGTVHAIKKIDGLYMTNCEFQGNISPFTADTNIINYTVRVIDCNYYGNSWFMYLGNVIASKIGKIEVISCKLGVGSEKFLFDPNAMQKIYILCNGYDDYPVLCKRYYGSLNETMEREFTVVGGIHRRVVSITAYQRDIDYMLTPITYTMPSSTTIKVKGTIPNLPCVLIVQYTNEEMQLN